MKSGGVREIEKSNGERKKRMGEERAGGRKEFFFKALFFNLVNSYLIFSLIRN